MRQTEPRELKLSVVELKKIIINCSEVAVQRHAEILKKGTGMLKKREVYRFLQEKGEKQSLLEQMEKDGLIKGHRKGKAINSPILYRKSELLAALAAINMTRL
ncbi:hypothetical protein EZS27_009369 [termite gut metagenome]|uniref:Uncharacterized protein n=1 Tax=termite gut metagenome TaxID=433724 RepID=A0A5J4S9X6_9ZZZZ